METNRPLASAGVILTAMAILAFVDQYVSVIAETSSLWTFHLLRSAMMFALAGAFVAVARRRLRVHNWRGLLGRSAFNSTAMMIYFGSLGFMPVAQAAAGLFTAPIWILLFSVGLFGLRVGPVRIAAVFIGFVGVLLVLSPDLSEVTPLTFVPAAAGAFYAVSAIATREWCPRERALELTLGIFAFQACWGLGGVLLTGGGDTFLTRGWVMPTPEIWGLLVMQAVGSLTGVVLLVRGYQLAEASLASVFEFSVLLFSALFGWLLLGQVLGPLGLAGLGLIALAGSLIALRGRTGAGKVPVT
ncbi:DMT family transporter [Jannaschia donghaensis]|uniref:Carboxylate/amino acid/amine transporter n=1 Tax=Jannaschia donghaensis TaxID=420998 RepID=A0A0M6YJ84_9RHOB|nr:DMT family transporter [Jannaschia donghaensis]CTQ50422.1 carboxylate/amino acid/amine transporter [Jannaschia donghaensis]